MLDLSDVEVMELYNLVCDYIKMLQQVSDSYKNECIKSLLDLRKRTLEQIEVFNSIKDKINSII